MLLWQLVAIQVLTFAVLVFLLRQFLYKQVTRSLRRLQELYQQNLQREEELKLAREAMEQELQAKLAEQADELERLRAVAAAEAQRTQEEILANARAEGRRIVADAEAQRERVRASLLSEAEEKAAALASAAIEQLFATRIPEGFHHQLIDELIDEIGKAEGGGLPRAADTVEVTVPVPLTPIQKANLTRILSSDMDHPVGITETVTQEIVAGMVVRIGGMVLDGSLKNRLKATLAYVRNHHAR